MHPLSYQGARKALEARTWRLSAEGEDQPNVAAQQAYGLI